MATVLKVPGIDSLSGGDLRALWRASLKLNVPVDWLAAIISFETAGSFLPDQPNKTGSRAFGLIQFLPQTAANILGMPAKEATEKGKEMSFSEQLERMVIPYFRSFGIDYQSLPDLYLAVFYPKAIGKADSWHMSEQGTPEYEQNRGFDREGKGYITKGDIVRGILAHYNRGTERIRIPFNWFAIVGSLAAAGTGLYAAQEYLPPRYRLPKRWTRPVNDFIRTLGV